MTQSAARNDAQHLHPLTAFRIVRGCLYLLYLAFTSFVFLTLLGPAVVPIRLVSLVWYRRIAGVFFGYWLSTVALVAEKFNGTKVVFSGEKVPPRERVLVICNHRTEVDWMYLWNLALRKDRIGCVRYAAKNSLRNIPMFGWACHLLEFLFLDRNWEKDEQIIANHLATFQDPSDPLWFIIFPEGTDYTDKKRARSQAFAEEKNLPKLTHTLLPRTKGFYASLTPLRGTINALYNVTIAYKYGCPSAIDHVFATDPVEVHMHVERIPLQNLPSSEADVAAWLYDAFRKKDEMLASFSKNGCFPDEIEETSVNPLVGILSAIGFLSVSLFVVWLIWHGASWLLYYVVISAMMVSVLCYTQWLPPPLVQVLEPHTRDYAKTVVAQKQE